MLLTTIIVFVIILSLLVFVHELGHYTVAKLIGVKVEEFGFGLPPRMWGKKVGETIYSINWLPLGGFVRLAGEDEEPDQKGATPKNIKRLFWARSKKERAAILLAGVTMNFLLAVGITTVLLTHGVNEPAGRVHIQTVVAGTPAAVAGLQVGDVVQGVKDAITDDQPHPVKTTKEFIAFVRDHAGKPIAITILRGEQTLSIVATPRTNPPPGQGALGVSISDVEKKKYSWAEAPVAAVRITAQRSVDMFTGVWTMISGVFQRKPVVADVAGPIGIAKYTGEAVKLGWEAVLEFAALLSLNLAVINVLPIPPLDGGRLLFVVLEKILGRKVKPSIEHSTHQIGMVLFLILFALISLNDILRIARGG